MEKEKCSQEEDVLLFWNNKNTRWQLSVWVEFYQEVEILIIGTFPAETMSAERARLFY